MKLPVWSGDSDETFSELTPPAAGGGAWCVVVCGGGGGAAELCGADGVVLGGVLDGVLGFGGAGFEEDEDGAGVLSVAVGAVTAPGFTAFDESLLLAPAVELVELVESGAAAVLAPEPFCVAATKASTQPPASTTAASA